METPPAAGCECECECEIGRLPEELLVQVISLTSPRDAFSAAAVSRAFRAAADSDAVWSRFLPRRELPRFAKGVLPKPTTPPMSKKALFRRFSALPALFPHKFMRMQLDKATGAEWFALSASGMHIARCVTHPCGTSRWIRVDPSRCSTRGRRSSEAYELSYMPKLQIGAKVQSKVLPRNTTYAAYMVFKLCEKFYGLDSPYQEASIAVAGCESTMTRQVCLQGYIDDGGQKHVLPNNYFGRSLRPEVVLSAEEVVFPRRRGDGWMEVELGELCNDGSGGEVYMSLKEAVGAKIKGGLVVRGIELRSKQQKPT